MLSNVISSQAAAHERFGGVVPEIASRHHVELVNAVVAAALADAGAELDEVEAIAVTVRPGLIGALLVGVSTAKALAAAAGKPLIPVDHLLGHVAASWLEPEPLEPPLLCLLASGGHTMLAAVRERGAYEVIGSTLDDAAGEALDKAARLLGLGYPGGPAIQRVAVDGDPEAFSFPVAMSRDPGLDFSFSGLKTALVYAVRGLEEEAGPDGAAEAVAARRADLAASFQAAVVGQLIAKVSRALDAAESAGDPWPALSLGGGVAANALLRERAAELCERRGHPAQAAAARALHRQRGDDRRCGCRRRAAGLPVLSRPRRRGDGRARRRDGATASAGRSSTGGMAVTSARKRSRG